MPAPVSPLGGTSKRPNRLSRTWRVCFGLAVALVAPQAGSASSWAAARRPPPAAVGATFVATIARDATGWTSTPVFAHLDGSPPSTYLGKAGGPPPVVLVIEPASDGWAHVLLPQRSSANSAGPAEGWMSTDGLSLVRTEYHLDIHLSQHRLDVTHNGRVIRRMTAATGMPDTPTPVLNTYIVAIAKPVESQGQNGPLGPFTLHLAAWSTVLSSYAADASWDGLIIQGTNCPTTCLGRAVTHGSVRVSNDNIIWLASHLPVGTPVRTLQ